MGIIDLYKLTILANVITEIKILLSRATNDNGRPH